MNKRDITKLSKVELIEEVLRLNNKIKDQSEEISILKRFIYAKKNEKWTKEDKTFSQAFNEAENTAEEEKEQKKTAPERDLLNPGRNRVENLCRMISLEIRLNLTLKRIRSSVPAAAN
jgi:hypothetical protein